MNLPTWWSLSFYRNDLPSWYPTLSFPRGPLDPVEQLFTCVPLPPAARHNVSFHPLRDHIVFESGAICAHAHDTPLPELDRELAACAIGCDEQRATRVGRRDGTSTCCEGRHLVGVLVVDEDYGSGQVRSAAVGMGALIRRRRHAFERRCGRRHAERDEEEEMRELQRD
jgi:hypothetical protein